MIQLLINAALLLLVSHPQASATAAQVQGRILRADNNEPIPQARLTLVRVPAPGADQLRIPDTVAGVSGADGGFVFDRVAPEKYRIVVEANGYVRQDYGPFDISAGKETRGLVIRMKRAGAVSGHISSAAGAVEGLEVVLVRSGYDLYGRKTYAAETSDRTNDQGAYRVFGVQPGRYYLVVRAPSSPRLTPGQPFNLSSMQALQKYATTYFPGTTDFSRADLIDIKAGAEVTGINLNVLEQQTYRVRGHIVDATTGQTPVLADRQSLGINIFPRPTVGLTGSTFSSSSYRKDGTFEFGNTGPGGYTLIGLIQAAPLPLNAQLRTTPEPARLAWVNFEVRNSDVEDLVLTFAPLARIPGHLSVEGQALSEMSGFDRFQAQLVSGDDFPHVPVPARLAREHTPPQADGSFVYESVVPGEYTFSFTEVPPNAYVKQVRYGQTDVLARPFKVTNDGKDSLNIVISMKAGQLDGTISEWASRPATTAEVILIPDRSRERSDLYRRGVVDGAAHFAIGSIPPGDYKLFAWEEPTRNSYFDPDFIRQFEDKAVAVHVTESSKQTLEVKRIPLQ